MRSNNRQRCHYATMVRQVVARRAAISALVTLAQFPDDSDAAIRSLRLLEAHPSEIEAEASSLARGGETAVRSVPR